MTERVHNFGGGPAALPLEVLEEAQRELTHFRNTGMSLMELSHRSPAYDQVHNEVIENVQKLLGFDGDQFAVLLLGGGARTQFVMSAYNLLRIGDTGQYISSGRWSELAFTEAGLLGNVKKIWSGDNEDFTRLPKPSEYNVNPNSRYLHITSNNTIEGTQYPAPPEAGDVPLVADMTSELFSRKLELNKYGVIYAAAQKNFGPAGVTAVIVRRDILASCRDDIPAIWSYKKIYEKNSLLNTPPTFNIYVMGLFLKHMIKQGGVEAMAQASEQKAEIMYSAIDNSDNFYRGKANLDSRSKMNVTFRLPTEELEAQFIDEAKQEGFVGIKGHRSVGGIRVSIYNAVKVESVRAMADFMQFFRENAV